MSKREPATIVEAFYGKEDHGIVTCDLRMRGAGWSQSFGGLALDEKLGPLFVSDLCALFDVVELDELKGLKCLVLRSFGHLNDRIEGLEYNGKRLTITSWQKKHYPSTPGRLEGELARLRSDIASRERTIVMLKRDLTRLEEEFTDWDTAP